MRPLTGDTLLWYYNVDYNVDYNVVISNRSIYSGTFADGGHYLSVKSVFVNSNFRKTSKSSSKEEVQVADFQ